MHDSDDRNDDDRNDDDGPDLRPLLLLLEPVIECLREIFLLDLEQGLERDENEVWECEDSASMRARSFGGTFNNAYDVDLEVLGVVWLKVMLGEEGVIVSAKRLGDDRGNDGNAVS
jgi:hypothetical protein